MQAVSSEQKAGRPLLVRVKRKRSDACVDDLVLEGLTAPSSKRTAGEGALLDHFKGLGLEGTAAGQPVQRQQRFRRVHTEADAACTSPDSLMQKLAAGCSPTQRESKGAAVSTPAAAARQRRVAERLQTGREARYQQVQWLRKSRMTQQDPLDELFHLYDIVCVSEEDNKPSTTRPVIGDAILCNYMPMVREYLRQQGRTIPEPEQQAAPPLATTTPEADDVYVYDYYAAVSDDDFQADNEDGKSCLPVIRVVDDEWFVEDGGEADSMADSQDSNAENFYQHDYPDEYSDSSSEAAYSSATDSASD